MFAESVMCGDEETEYDANIVFDAVAQVERDKSADDVVDT